MCEVTVICDEMCLGHGTSWTAKDQALERVEILPYLIHTSADVSGCLHWVCCQFQHNDITHYQIKNSFIIVLSAEQ